MAQQEVVFHGGVVIRTIRDVKCLRQNLVTRVRHCEAVVSRQQQSVVFSMLIGPERTHIPATSDLHHCILDWQPRAIEHTTFDPQVDLLDEGQQRLPVLRPQSRKLLNWRKLAAGNLQSQLQTLSPHIVIVLHPTYQRIPLVSVGDAVQERSAVVTAVAVVHGGVVVGVHLGQVNEHVVIRGDAGSAHLLAPSVAVVVRITGHQRSTMKVGGENKTFSPQPANHSSDLRLPLPVVELLLPSETSERIGEVPVQINAVMVEPALAVLAVCV